MQEHVFHSAANFSTNYLALHNNLGYRNIFVHHFLKNPLKLGVKKPNKLFS